MPLGSSKPGKWPGMQTPPRKAFIAAGWAAVCALVVLLYNISGGGGWGSNLTQVRAVSEVSTRRVPLLGVHATNAVALTALLRSIDYQVEALWVAYAPTGSEVDKAELERVLASVKSHEFDLGHSHVGTSHVIMLPKQASNTGAWNAIIQQAAPYWLLVEPGVVLAKGALQFVANQMATSEKHQVLCLWGLSGISDYGLFVLTPPAVQLVQNLDKDQAQYPEVFGRVCPMLQERVLGKYANCHSADECWSKRTSSSKSASTLGIYRIKSRPVDFDDWKWTLGKAVYRFFSAQAPEQRDEQLDRTPQAPLAKQNGG